MCPRNIALKYGPKIRRTVAGFVLFGTSAVVFAQTSGGSTDPTTSILAQLATYLADVASIASAVLLIVYGKKLVGYLKV